MAFRETPRQKLDALIDLFTPEIRGAFEAAIQDIVDNVILQRVINAIEVGDVEAAFRALGFSDAAMRPLTAALESAFERGGVMTGESFPRYLNTASGRAVFRFDVRNSRAERWLRENSSALVTRIQEDTRTVLRNVLTEGMQIGDNPRRVALNIVGRVNPSTRQREGGFIGLTPQQERWISNTRRDLEDLNSNYFNRALRDKRFDRIVAKAIKDGKPLNRETIDKLVAASKIKTLKYRGDTIARTEALRALNQSEYEAHKQAVDLGAVQHNAIKRVWDSAGDSRVRWSHKRLDGKTVGIDEPFVSPSGAHMMYPGDTSLGAPGDEVIMCRCRVRLKVDWLADLD